MKVKVCGLKNIKELEWAIKLQYDFAGIVVYKKSKRYVDFKQTIKMLEFAKNKIKTVVVSLNFKDVIPYVEISDFFQVYEYVEFNLDKFIFASDTEPANKDYKYFLYDTSRGSGEFRKFPNWLYKFREKLIIAGGLNCENVKTIKDLKPEGVDVSSGVEVSGKKDYFLMKKFINNCKSLSKEVK